MSDVTVTIDGKQISVPQGTLIIRAAEALGIEIPRFCDHPLLEPVGACRTCMVEVEGQRKPMTSCTTPVSEGMQVRTQHTSESAKKAQEGQLEFLLINHPLDCPVCDRGGECPLQDQTLAFGPAESRYIDPKRVYRKPLPLSPLVLLDRERCVLCARCTRFCDQISGERFIELFERGAAEQVSIAPGEDFRSPFSGNTVQICPVGALTSSTYRFAARPFDVKSADSVCPHCACGCNIRVDVRRGEVVRHLARDNLDVNDAWLCDKGRYAFRFPDSDRLTTPMLRMPGLEPASYREVFSAIAERARGGRVAFLGGSRLTDEDNYAMAKLARTVFGTNDIDHRLMPQEGALELEAAAAAPGTPVTYADVEAAPAIIVVGLDPREELPILHLRIRKAVRNRGARVFVIHPRRTALEDVATHIPCRPAQEAELLDALAHGGEGPIGEAAAAVSESGGDAVILAGPRLGATALKALPALARRIGAKVTLLPRRANDRGALRAGVHPGLLPGGRSVGAAGRVGELWGPVPSEPGLNGREILEACARREVDVLFLVGVDPLRDAADAELARAAVANAHFRVLVDIAGGDYDEFVDAVLPAAAFLEKEGHLTDWEGRGQRISPVRQPPGVAKPEWQIFQELSEAMERDMGFASLEALHEEMGALLAPRDDDSTVMAATATDVVDEAGEVGPAGALTLFTYPLLVDDGRLIADATELKAALQGAAFVELNPIDAERLGIADGAAATVETERGSAVLRTRVSDGIVAGAAFVPWNQPGFAANRLLDGRTVLPATLAPAGDDAPVEGDAPPPQPFRLAPEPQGLEHEPAFKGDL